MAVPFPVNYKIPQSDDSNKRQAITFPRQAIHTRDQLKDWTVRHIGWPLQTAELTDAQLDDCIDDSTMLWTKFATLPRKYLVVNFKDYQKEDETRGILEGIFLGKWRVAAVHSIGANDAFGMYGADTLWGLSNCMLATGTYPFMGSLGGTSGSYEGFTTYQCAFEFCKTARRLLAQEFDYDFDTETQMLTTIPNPSSKPGISDMNIVLEVEVVPPDDVLYGKDWIKRMTLACAKKTVGLVRKKFANASFAGGITVDTSIGDEGNNEYKDLLDRLQKEETPGCGGFIA
jgi:hypothetical protein